eukprot:3684182-Ditylum_brightwellii.AAC.1
MKPPAIITSSTHEQGKKIKAQKSCTKGLALLKIKKHTSNKDGTSAHKELKDTYKMDGDRDTYGGCALEKLLCLKLQ